MYILVSWRKNKLMDKGILYRVYKFSIAILLVFIVLINYSIPYTYSSSISRIPEPISKALEKSFKLGVYTRLEHFIETCDLSFPYHRFFYNNTVLYEYLLYCRKYNRILGIVLYIEPDIAGLKQISYVIDLRTMNVLNKTPVWIIVNTPIHIKPIDFVDKIIIPLIDSLIDLGALDPSNTLLRYSDFNLTSIDLRVAKVLIGKLLLYDMLLIDNSINDTDSQPLIGFVNSKKASIIAYTLASRLGFNPYLVNYVFKNRDYWFTITEYLPVSSVDRLYRVFIDGTIYGVYYACIETFYHWPMLISRQVLRGKHSYNTTYDNVMFLDELSKKVGVLFTYSYNVISDSIESRDVFKWRKSIVYELSYSNREVFAYFLAPKGIPYGGAQPITWCSLNIIDCTGPSCLVLDFYNVLKSRYYPGIHDRLKKLILSTSSVRGFQDPIKIYYPWMLDCWFIEEQVFPQEKTYTPTKTTTPINITSGLSVSPNILIPLTILNTAIAFIILILLKAREPVSRKSRVVKKGAMGLGEASVLSGSYSKTYSIGLRHLVILWFIKTLSILEKRLGYRRSWETHRDYGERVKRVFGDRVYRLYGLLVRVYEKARFTRKTVTRDDLDRVVKYYREISREVENNEGSSGSKGS